MKVAIVVLASMAFASSADTSDPLLGFGLEEEFRDQQEAIIDFIIRLEVIPDFEGSITLGSKLIVDKAMYKAFDDSMVSFSSQYEMGSIVPRGQFFSVTQPYHAKQALGLFKFFYYARDWDTLVSNIANICHNTPPHSCCMHFEPK